MRRLPTLRQRSTYRRTWDRYVRKSFPAIQRRARRRDRPSEPWRVLNEVDDQYAWPGDEWGDRETTERIFDESVTARVASEATYLLELGAGSGRFTSVALQRFPSAVVLSFDVSPAFEQALRKRCAEDVAAGRLDTFRIGREPTSVLDTVRALGIERRVDAMYSFDAMVHVDLHSLVVYWITAAMILRPGGVLAMNIADATTETGFMKLVHDAGGAFRRGGDAGPQFMWSSQHVAQECLGRLGFDVESLPGNGRDAYVVATLADVDRAAAWLRQSNASWLCLADLDGRDDPPHG